MVHPSSIGGYKAAVIDLDKLVRKKMTCFVNCKEHFAKLPGVTDGASKIINTLFNSKIARTTTGASQLPRNYAVEIEGIWELLE